MMNIHANNPTQDALDLVGLNERHAQRSDKFFRMYAGAASTLTGFRAGVIYLDIRVDIRVRFPLEALTRNIAESWRRENELCSATDYCASIYLSSGWLGFILGGPNIHSEQKIQEAVKRLKESADSSDAFVTRIKGAFG
jgi:hypothetical protein